MSRKQDGRDRINHHLDVLVRDLDLLVVRFVLDNKIRLAQLSSEALAKLCQSIEVCLLDDINLYEFAVKDGLGSIERLIIC